jgi:dTDP-4-dehydrorhamnose 3,5-epimerase
VPRIAPRDPSGRRAVVRECRPAGGLLSPRAAPGGPVAKDTIAGAAMKVIETALPGVLIVEPDVHRDGRGFFLEAYHATRYERAGIAGPFVQDNHSRSAARTLRGLHLQLRSPQGKLVRVVAGEVLDVAADVRRGSPTFGRSTTARLSADNFRQLYVPPGFAHGFYVLSDEAQVEYKCTSVYDAASEVGIIWNDPQLAIAWPDRDPILSSKDAALPQLAELLDRLPAFRP